MTVLQSLTLKASQANTFFAKFRAQNREKAAGLFWRIIGILPFFRLKITFQLLGLFFCLLIISISTRPDEYAPAYKLPLLHIFDGDTVIYHQTGYLDSRLASSRRSSFKNYHFLHIVGSSGLV